MAQARGQNQLLGKWEDLEIQEGLNLRTPTREAIEEKKISIRANGVITDFKTIFNPKTGKHTVIEGHTRYIAIGEDIKAGNLPVDFLIPCKAQNEKSDIDIVFAMFTNNSGEPLPPIAKAEGYRRLIHFGQTVAQISDKLGISVQHINDCLLLLNANSGLQEKIKTNQVSATVVTSKLKEGKGSDEIEQEITATQKKTGKKKIMPKDLPAKIPTVKTKQSNLYKETSKVDSFITWMLLNRQGDGSKSGELDTKNKTLNYDATMLEFLRLFR